MSSVQSARWWTPRVVGDRSGRRKCSCMSVPQRGYAHSIRERRFPVDTGRRMKSGNALFGGLPDRRCGAPTAGGQIEQIGGQVVEIRENFGRWEDVGIFGKPRSSSEVQIIT